MRENIDGWRLLRSRRQRLRWWYGLLVALPRLLLPRRLLRRRLMPPRLLRLLLRRRRRLRRLRRLPLRLPLRRLPLRLLPLRLLPLRLRPLLWVRGGRWRHESTHAHVLRARAVRSRRQQLAEDLRGTLVAAVKEYAPHCRAQLVI